MGNWDIRTCWFDCAEEAEARRVYARLEAFAETSLAPDSSHCGIRGLAFGLLAPRLVVAHHTMKWGEDDELAPLVARGLPGVALVWSEQETRLGPSGRRFPWAGYRLALSTDDPATAAKLSALAPPVPWEGGQLVALPPGSERWLQYPRRGRPKGLAKIDKVLPPREVPEVTSEGYQALGLLHPRHGFVPVGRRNCEGAYDFGCFLLPLLLSRWAGYVSPIDDQFKAHPPPPPLPDLPRWRRDALPAALVTEAEQREVEAALADPDPLERQAALDQVRRWGLAELLPRAEAALEDADGHVRAAAEQAVAALTPAPVGREQGDAQALAEETAAALLRGKTALALVAETREPGRSLAAWCLAVTVKAADLPLAPAELLPLLPRVASRLSEASGKVLSRRAALLARLLHHRWGCYRRLGQPVPEVPPLLLGRGGPLTTAPELEGLGRWRGNWSHGGSAFEFWAAAALLGALYEDPRQGTLVALTALQTALTLGFTHVPLPPSEADRLLAESYKEAA